MAKIGRNERCPCGSGKKYKHCHGSIHSAGQTQAARAVFPSNDMLRQMFARREAEIQQQQAQQGLGRPIISLEVQGQRIVCVGMRVFYSPRWKTFHDFLRDYPVMVFGEIWQKKQTKKAVADRHPYLQWMEQALADHHRLARGGGEIKEGPATAAISAVMAFAYNLYLVHHNLPTSPKTDQLLAKLVKRLKDPDHFWGALYETYAFALFALAGFAMELEDESDGSDTHCEFHATSLSGRRYSIECKGRNRPTVPLNADGSPRIDDQSLGVSKKLKDALSKTAPHDRVVFIDIDIPLITNAPQFEEVAKVVSATLRELEGTLEIDGQSAPCAYVFVTNTPDHRNTSDDAVGLMAFAEGFKIPNFGHSVVHQGAHAYIQAQEQHNDIFSLKKAFAFRHTIPATFDGTNPALTFSGNPQPRLVVGNRYRIPIENGEIVEAELTNGVVMEDQKMAMCFYRLPGDRIVTCQTPLTDDELKAYRLHPNTFFGIVDVNAGRPSAETVLDLFEFFFASYKNTPKEKLLNFFSGAPDLDYLRKLSQKDLAITYCERMAIHVQNQHPPEPKKN